MSSSIDSMRRRTTPITKLPSGPVPPAPRSRRATQPDPHAPQPPTTRRGSLARHETKQTRPVLPRIQPPPGVLPFAPLDRSGVPQSPKPDPVVNVPSSQPPRGSLLPAWGSSPPNLSRRPPVSRGVELARMAEALAGETVMGRYRVEFPLGRGSTGIVFQAHDLPRGVKVALKFLDPELSRDAGMLERFRHEALTPSKIGTQHVVDVLEADVCPELVPIVRPDEPMSPPIPYLVMELLEGKDLRQTLNERGALDPREVVEIFEQIAPTLDRAHAMGVVHRDLKPANLFLSRRPDGSPLVKILDFGIALLTDASAARGLGGGLFGTPWYMAPEQAEGGIATPASDRWALAVVAFRLLTAESYWAPCPIPELLGQIIDGPQVPPSWVVRERGLLPVAPITTSFDAWFMRACQVHPQLRFSSAVEQVAVMRAALLEQRRDSK